MSYQTELKEVNIIANDMETSPDHEEQMDADIGYELYYDYICERQEELTKISNDHGLANQMNDWR